MQTDASTAPDSLLVLADPTASNLIQVGEGASGAVLREPDVASLVTRLMGVDSPLAATRFAATPLPSGNVFVRPTASVIAVLDGVDKKLSERVQLVGASAQTYALQRSRVGTVASAAQRIVPSLLFGDDSAALRAAYPSALVVCGAAAQSEACAGHAGARAEASFSVALLERAAPLAATFGDAVAFGAHGTLVALRDGGATLDMAQPAQRAVVDELLQLAAMAGSVGLDSKAALAEDAAPALFVLHFSALSALRGDAAHAAAEAFTAALLPVVLAQWNHLTARPVDEVLFLAPATALGAAADDTSSAALRAAHASLTGLLAAPTSFEQFRAALPLVALRAGVELPLEIRSALCGADSTLAPSPSPLVVYCPRAGDAAPASAGVARAARRRLQGLVATEWSPQGKNYTLSEIEDYQIGLWSSVGLVLTVGAAIFLLTTVDPGADPSGMFAKFDVQGGDPAGGGHKME